MQRYIQLGKITSGLLHDLSNPLTAVSCALQELAEQKQCKPDRYPDRTTLVLAQRGVKQIEDMLNNAKNQLSNKQTIQYFWINKELEKTIALFHYQCRKHSIRIHVVNNQPLRYRGACNRYHQVVANIVSNAVDALVHIRNRERQITVTQTIVNNQIHLTVQDTGSGITKKNLSRVFTPLFTTKKRTGIGIGLTLVQDIVIQEMNGTIDLSSKPNKGTRITISFPVPSLAIPKFESDS